MAQLRQESRPVFRVSVYSASAGEGFGKVFDVPQEAFDHFLELAAQKLTPCIYHEFVQEWVEVE